MSMPLPAHLLQLETAAWSALCADPLDVAAARTAAAAVQAAIVEAAPEGGRYALEMAVKHAVRHGAG